ncbi:uncharacterized protein LOC143464053 [Clavelina lepadiformis]|uniref:uncharacterized protein LOC143464053 n=1 Tax=Clavelina lepadiformis TaxID=159417 RepID=UPI0040436A46
MTTDILCTMGDEINGVNNNEIKSTIENIKFKWTQEVPQYGHKLLQRLDEFRNKHIFYDVTLKTIDEDLSAHKVVLAACGGMFRSHFVNSKTKRIADDVTEVNFDCTAAGLRTILKFAYSGLLEINEKNLLPTLLAAIISEMKEVQEICADIAMSRLGWMLTFDGSEEMLPTISAEGKTNRKKEPSPSLDHAFEILHKILQFNDTQFPKRIAEEESNCEEKLSQYPCLKEVQLRFPELETVYVSMLNCLRKAKMLEKMKEERHPSHENPSKETSKLESANVAKKQEMGSVNDSEEVLSDKAENKNTLDEEERREPAVTASDTSKVETAERNKACEKSENDGKDATATLSSEPNQAPKPRARKQNSNELSKPPISKPRTVSMPVQKKDSLNGKAEAKKSRPASPPKDQSKSLPHSSSPAGLSIHSPSLSPAPPSPLPSKKKSAAPKPPGQIAPVTTATTPSTKPAATVKDAAGRTPPPRPKMEKATASPRPARSGSTKVPPPRPKPPSVKRPPVVSEDNDKANYDDALNPFAEETEQPDDYATSTKSELKETGSNGIEEAESKKSDYDESLNPFG